MCKHIYSGYYPAMRKREMLPFATTLMELEGSMLSKKADTEILNALTCMQNLKYRNKGINIAKQSRLNREQTNGC